MDSRRNNGPDVVETDKPGFSSHVFLFMGQLAGPSLIISLNSYIIGIMSVIAHTHTHTYIPSTST